MKLKLLWHVEYTTKLHYFMLNLEYAMLLKNCSFIAGMYERQQMLLLSRLERTGLFLSATYPDGTADVTADN